MRLLTTCNNITEAYILKGKLANEGIPSYIVNENFSQLLPMYNNMLGSGFRLQIDEENYEQASSILGISKAGNLPPVCANCGNTELNFGLGKRKFWKICLAILSTLIAVPLGNIRGHYFCNQCGQQNGVA
ncbi:MAG: DUF2007 domain-containing protein [Luteibaculum sp.]